MAWYVKGTEDMVQGTLDLIPGCAAILGRNLDGTPQFAGGTDVFWDDQKTVMRPGPSGEPERVFCIEGGGECLESEIEWREDSSDDEEDDEREANARELARVLGPGW